MWDCISVDKNVCLTRIKPGLNPHKYFMNQEHELGREHACNLSLKLKAGRSEAQGHPQLHSELESSLEQAKLCMKGRRKEGGKYTLPLICSSALLFLFYHGISQAMGIILFLPNENFE